MFDIHKKCYLGLTVTIKSADNSVLISLVLMFSATDTKIKIGTTVTPIVPPIKNGEILDVYISCNEIKFQVIDWFRSDFTSKNVLEMHI